MSRTKLMAAAVAATILITGCSKEETPTTPQRDNDRALNVTGGIQALTRAHDATWETGDAIGIYMFENKSTTISEGAENRKYTTTGNGSFSPVTTPADQTIYFPITGKTDFTAYYPWQSITKDANDKYFYAVDVSNQTSQKAIDLMAAAMVIAKDKDHRDVKFEFAHQLAKIVLTDIKHGEGLTADDLMGLTVKLTKQYTKATYNIMGGDDVAVNTTETPTDITLLVAADSKSAEAIVLPAPSTTGMELVFTLANGDEYRWALSNAIQSRTFTAAHKYGYKITISKKGLNITSSIFDWLPGNGTDEEGTAQ